MKQFYYHVFYFLWKEKEKVEDAMVLRSSTKLKYEDMEKFILESLNEKKIPINISKCEIIDEATFIALGGKSPPNSGSFFGG